MADTLSAKPVQPYSLGRRVVDVFVAPATLCEHFRHRTPWVGPLVVVALAGVAVVLLVPHELFLAEARDTVQRAAAQGVATPPAERIAAIARVAAAAGGAIGTPIMAFVVAGVLALTFSVVGDGKASYAQYLTVTTHSMLITAVGGLITLPVQIASGDLRARLALSVFTPSHAEYETAFRVAHGVEVFTIWSLLVIGTGVAVVNRRASRIGPIVIVLGIYVLTLFAVAVFTA